MFNFTANRHENIVHGGHDNIITDNQFVEAEIERWKSSDTRKAMIDGEKYYQGKQAILERKRTVIGAGGKLDTVDNLPNNRIVDNQYRKMVDQKCNYLLGKPISFQCDNDTYADILKQTFGRRFARLLKSIGEDSLNGGIAWMYLYYDDMGQLAFRRFKPYEIIPGWKDEEHTVLDYAIRLYKVPYYEGKEEKQLEKVEVYENSGISYFELNNGGKLIPCKPYHQNYFTLVNDNQEKEYNWSRIPLIPWRYNNKEIPLISMVKSLQDGINQIESNFQNQMEEDPRNTILVLVNYDGENLGEFRQNLATYGAVKVRSVDGSGGDVRTLQVQVNAENYKSILEIFKKAIIENARGYDAKDDRLAGNPNQLNIQSMYSDIDLDANGMETEYQASFEELLWFLNNHLYNTGKGNFEGMTADVIFNRDMLMNESESIDQCIKSMGLLSTETIIAQHPWVNDVKAELERIEAQKAEEAKLLADYSPFDKNDRNDEDDE